MFSKRLLHWHQHDNRRTMPWKGETDPYKIWISEIILQQTRVEQGTKYYEALIAAYPTVHALAQADETTLYTYWQGLGYYNRCKNMQFTAREISTKMDGQFPTSYEEIIKLKGIGEYTAAAISSFAFHLPYAVVDGNVVRILSRVFALHDDFNTPQGKKTFKTLAQKLLAKKQNALYNQAIMDLGATICKPRNPACVLCPMQKICIAYKTNTIEDFPLKKTPLTLKSRHFHFLVFELGEYLFIRQRNHKDIWQNLFEFYAIEAKTFDPATMEIMQKAVLIDISAVYTQVLTHQKINAHFYRIRIRKASDISALSLLQVKKSDLTNFAFPRLIISFLENNHYL